MKALLKYIILLIIVIFILSMYIPYRYQVKYPKFPGPTLDSRIRSIYKDVLDERHSEIVFMGDSTLNDAVDELLIEEQWEKDILWIGVPGSAATLWYLILKNNLVVGAHKPKYLVMFVRDSVMTVPHYRTTGMYTVRIDEFANSEDDVLLEKAYTNQMSSIEKMAEKYLPVFGSRWRIRETIDFYIRYPLPRKMINCGRSCMIMAMKIVFSEADIDEKHLDEALFAADSVLYKNQSLDFNNTVDASLLPDIIRICRENNIQLILVRMKTLRFPTQKEEPPGLQTYFVQMQKYLEENGVEYLDLSNNPTITKEHFADSLHMNLDGMGIFTSILIEELEKVIEIE